MISNGYPDFPESYRGIFIKKLCLALKAQGIDTIVLTPQVFRQSPRFELDDDIPVYRFRYPSDDKPLNQTNKVPIIAMSIYMLTGLCKALTLVIKERPDIIHGHWIVPTGLIAGIVGKITRTPVINTARGMDTRIGQKGPIGLLFRLATNLSDRLVIVSRQMQSIASLRNAEIIPSGSADIFSSIEPGNRPPIILYARSMEKIYDPATFIRSIPHVLKKHPDARFLMVGDGSMLEILRALVNKLNVSDFIEIRGRVSNEEVAQIMAKSKIFISTATEDGTSIALLEAISAGLIPVVTDIEANHPWINHGSDGYLFPPGNDLELANRIIDALNNRITISTLEKKRTQVSCDTSWTTIAQRYVDLYTSMT